LSEWSEKKQDFQDDVKTAFTELVKLSKLIKGSGADSDNYLKKIFIKSLKELQPQLKEIFIDTTKKTLGCSTDQILPANSPQYIPVQSVDFFDYLTISADTKLGKLIYEPNLLNYYSYPFTMNKCLYDRIQNLGQPLSAVAGTPYVGTSTQNIFDVYTLGNEFAGSIERIFTISNIGFTCGLFGDGANGTFKRIINKANPEESKSKYYIRKHLIVSDYNDAILTNAGFENNGFRKKTKYESSSLTPNFRPRVSVKESNQTYNLSFKNDNA
jgi:hypothetical protein